MLHLVAQEHAQLCGANVLPEQRPHVLSGLVSPKFVESQLLSGGLPQLPKLRRALQIGLSSCGIHQAIVLHGPPEHIVVDVCKVGMCLHLEDSFKAPAKSIQNVNRLPPKVCIAGAGANLITLNKPANPLNNPQAIGPNADFMVGEQGKTHGNHHSGDLSPESRLLEAWEESRSHNMGVGWLRLSQRESP